MHVFYTINYLKLPQITILIIDNDKTVRTTLKQILAANNGLQAVEKFQPYNNEI